MASTKHVNLFGGAITCSIPSHWRDVSTVRQVPDNQEVYQDCSEETGGVMVIEILERQEDVKDADAPQFFFGDLSESNGCGDDDWRIERVFDGNGEANGEEHVARNILQSIKQTSSKNSCVVVVGLQNVIQGKAYTGTGASAKKTILVEMCILRLESVETDLLLTLSTPVGSPTTDLSDHFQAILTSFSIKDWSLFG